MYSACRSGFAQGVGVLLVAGAVIAGCGRSGSGRNQVSGSVSFGGEKVAEGTIAFVPIQSTKGPKVGANIEQGQYHIDRAAGPVAGTYRVEITALRKTGKQYEGVGKQMLDEKKNVVPAKYSGEKSELVAEIKSGGKNVFDYDLKAE
jgi:hypothetical protein